jgi:hypothetical protein
MLDDPTDSGARSIDTVIRGFTDAELALREVAGAVERMRSASEQLDASTADQAAAREVLAETTRAVTTLAQREEDLRDSLTEIRGTLTTLEPERLWLVLDELSVRLRHNGDQLDAHGNRLRRATLLIYAGLGVGAAGLALLAAIVIGLMPLS